MISTYEDTIQWLHRFGYLTDTNPTADMHDEAVAAMQAAYRLKTDGDAGPVTRRAMAFPRCGKSDRRQMRDKPPRWTRKNIKYWISPSLVFHDNKKLPRTLIAQGFRVYEPLTGLKFHEVKKKADADIRIAKGRGYRDGFDGVGSTLAWADMPDGRRNNPRDVKFDAAEPWALHPFFPGVYFLAVWMHELGHVLGLDHSNDPESLMAPHYNSKITVPQRPDILALSELYGQANTNIADVAMPGAYRVSGSLVVRDNSTVLLDLKDIKPT